ncbi:diguanylate cyclase [Aestuariicella hydrocarbonica]|uniref:diguanylate cyclase n=1 Tax=Pseudomaricurvus hydrocarbonicus TaxID=1470433 RepID=A0A9E5JZ34_9GAMM|nr:GGDEF domain-containing response regulator [Aestuariicella hydrocarbonica]NHO65057.1 diguanylate cyclase [Aestuariicella hydrocarbonica]
MNTGQIRVLVVDDDPDDFYLVNEMLKQSQRKAFVVTHCESLECAGQVLQRSPVDIVLLDLGLGPLQGIQTLESFLSLGFCTPVIVLTGVHDEVLGEQSIKLGAEDYLPKNEASSALLIRAITYAIERYALVEQLEKRANEDALTGLANRHALMGQTTTLINNLERSGSTLAVALLDLDDFKGVNDRWGHNAGDQVIVALAHRLQSHLRSSDLVARIGGDEFVWVLTNYSSADNLVDVIEKKLSYLMQPLVLEEYPDDPKQLIKVSLGVAEWKPGLGLKELLSRADKAMYQSKKSRNQGVVIY